MKVTRLNLIFLVIIAVVCMTAIVGCNEASDRGTYTLTYTAGEGGRISGATEQEIAKGNDGEAVEAIADEGYKFVKWSDGLRVAGRQDRNITADKSVTAEFAPLRYYTLNYAAEEGGHIEGEAEQTVLELKNGTTVIAVADAGYKFGKWSDGVLTAERQDKIVVSDKSVTAEFMPLEYCTLKYAAEEGGRIEGEAEQKVLEQDFGTAVKAVAAEGYKFVCWSDGSTEAERQDKAQITFKTVTARFEKLSAYTVEYKTNSKYGVIEGDARQIVYEGSAGTTVTAVATNPDWEFYQWSDGVETASRNDLNVTTDIKVIAYFRQEVFTYRYQLGSYTGRIEGETEQRVKRGESGTTVIAVPDEGYAVSGWSDGSLDPVRRDSGDEDKYLTVWFKKKITVRYRVNKGIGGRIEGETEQALLEGRDSTVVKAVANVGYIFTGWSDGLTDAERNDENLLNDFSMTAYFEPLEKVFRYDYRGATANARIRTVTVRRDKPKASEFVVPQKTGYNFVGWYADENYATRVTDENGGLMYGYNTVTLETDTLYARWADPNDQSSVFKILVVVVDEIDATLKLREDYTQLKQVHHKITMPERLLCKQIAGRMSGYLNEWFAKKGVRFEIDTYFTTQAVDTEDFYNSNDWLNPYRMKETNFLYDKYDSYLTFFDMNDYENEFKDPGVKGLAGWRQGSIYLEDLMSKVFQNKTVAEKVMQGEGYEDRITDSVITIGIHEFVHTVEDQYNYGELYEYDIAVTALWYSGIHNFLEISRLYLLCEAEIDGEKVGMPPKYWAEELWKEHIKLDKED